MTSICQLNFVIARDTRPSKSPVGIFSLQISKDLIMKTKFQVIFHLQTTLTTNIILSKHTGSIKCDTKTARKKVGFIF